MEPVESMSEGEWSSLSGMYNTTEEADFMAQLLANSPMPSVLESYSTLGVRSHLWPGHDSVMDMEGINKSVHYSSELASTNLFHYSRKNSFSGSNSSFFPTHTSSSGNYVNNSHPVNNNSSMLMDFDNGDAKHVTSYLTPGDECISGCNVEQESRGNQLDNGFPHKGYPDVGKKNDMQVIASLGEDTNVLENKRRTRTAEVQTNKRNVRTSRNKNQSPSAKTKEDSNEGANGQSASTNCSENDSDALQNDCAGLSPSVSSKENPASPNSKGKSRATRGTATDPQSLYARNRRERINERLRILQSLVPNGTKVDISTMLEEAVRYVKFLQLQIKLLSSDDLWMYSPIAYNGMNIGLDLNIPLPPKRS